MLWGTFFPTGVGTINFNQIFRMNLTSPTNVQLTRTTASPTSWDYTIFVMEFPVLQGGLSGWNIQRGTELFGAGDITRNVTIFNTNLSVSFSQATGLHSGCLGHCQSDDISDDYNENRISTLLTTTTNLQIQRTTSGPSLDVAWEVADLTPSVFNPIMFGNNV